MQHSFICHLERESIYKSDFFIYMQSAKYPPICETPPYLLWECFFCYKFSKQTPYASKTLTNNRIIGKHPKNFLLTYYVRKFGFICFVVYFYWRLKKRHKSHKIYAVSTKSGLLIKFHITFNI